MPHHVTAVLLAAGSSRRMGRPKTLLPLHGKPVIRHCLDAIFASGMNEAVVVLAPESDEIRKAIQDLAVTVVFNPRKESEMADSVRVGFGAVDDACSGVFISLSDQPLVTARTYEILAEIHHRKPDRILIPIYGHKRGHPTLFPMPLLQEVFSGANLREIIQKSRGKMELVPVPDEGVVLDMDTEEDYRQILEKSETSIVPYQ